MIQEAHIEGISTRSVDDLVKVLGMTGVSKSQVSRLCGELDEQVGAFLNRTLEGDWPYFWSDATYANTREAGRIVSVAIIVAFGVNIEGERELLGLKVGASEAGPFWREFLRSLNRRCLRGVKLVISDSHEGIKAAASKVPKATWQRCRVHFVRDSLAFANNTRRRMVSAANDARASGLHWTKPRTTCSPSGPLRAHWPQIYSKNPLQPLNAQIKRRARSDSANLHLDGSMGSSHIPHRNRMGWDRRHWHKGS